MQKKVVFLLLTIIILCSFTFQAEAVFNFSVGDEFQYDIKKWNCDATNGPNSSSAQGFTIDNQHFDEGEDILVKVNSMADNCSVGYSIEKEGYSISKGTSCFGSYLNLFLLVTGPTHFVLPQWYWNPWNETRIQQGPELLVILLPFHNTEGLDWDYFKQIANSSYISSQMAYTSLNYTDLQGTYEEKRDLAFIERYAYFNRQIDDGVTTYDVTTIFNILFSIKFSTGVLQGFRCYCSQIGTFNGSNFVYESNLHLELKGYNLPNFNLGEYAGLPGFSFYFVPISLMILIITRFFFKKKRNKY